MSSATPHPETRQNALLIQCLRIHKSFGRGRLVFQDVDLEIGKGDFAFLMGPSGTGKTTFLRLLLGLEPPSHGHILFEGRSLQRMSPGEISLFRRRTGIVFQDLKLMMDRTVYDNVALPLEIAGKDSKVIRNKVAQVLSMLDFEHKTGSKCAHLSVSEQQRVAVARAAVNDPALLLLDEPTGKVDEETRHQLMEFLGTIHVRGTAVVIASHEPALVDMVPHGRVLAIHDNRILERVVLPNSTVWQ